MNNEFPTNRDWYEHCERMRKQEAPFRLFVATCTVLGTALAIAAVAWPFVLAIVQKYGN